MKPLLAALIAGASLWMAPGASACSWTSGYYGQPTMPTNFTSDCTQNDMDASMQFYYSQKPASVADVAALQKQVADLQKAVDKIAASIAKAPAP